MSGGVHFYEPAKGHGLPHDPFKAIIAPRPIGWISTVDEQGRGNLAPYSFFNALSSAPPIIGFASEGWKHTAANIQATGEFVFNLATAALAGPMNASGAKVADDVDEMQLVGLTPASCRIVRAARVAESPAAFECKALDITELKDLDGKALGRFLITGQVIGVHIDEHYLTPDGLFDTALARPLARCGYVSDFAEVSSLLRIDRV